MNCCAFLISFLHIFTLRLINSQWYDICCVICFSPHFWQGCRVLVINGTAVKVLSELYFWRLLQVRLHSLKVFQSRNFWNWWCSFFTYQMPFLSPNQQCWRFKALKKYFSTLSSFTSSQHHICTHHPHYFPIYIHICLSLLPVFLSSRLMRRLWPLAETFNRPVQSGSSSFHSAALQHINSSMTGQQSNTNQF